MILIVLSGILMFVVMCINAQVLRESKQVSLRVAKLNSMFPVLRLLSFHSTNIKNRKISQPTYHFRWSSMFRDPPMEKNAH